MPVRSTHSSVLRWPDEERVRSALASWASVTAAQRPFLVRVGYFGSYATGDWGPGSDVDVVLVVRESPRPFIERGAGWDLTALPVPAQALVYTAAEWSDLEAGGGRFAEVLLRDTVWVYEAAPEPGPEAEGPTGPPALGEGGS